MDELSPTGKVYQAGTLSGNPLAVAAGLKTLDVLERDNPYPRMAELGQRLADTVNTAAVERGLPFHCAQYKGVFTFSARRRRCAIWPRRSRVTRQPTRVSSTRC